MMSSEEQERLTRVGPGTPMGTLLRCYWYPILASVELAPGQSREVRLLGEDLAVFRQPDGQLGLVTRQCPHRGTSLGRGLVSDRGVICPYHGWTFDRNGDCQNIPSEQQTPRLLASARIKGYPVEELGGLVFAYLGVQPTPLLPRYDLYVRDNVLRDIGRAELRNG